MTVLNAAGIATWARRRGGGEVAVLMYHGVLPDDEPSAEGDWLQVRTSEFRAQMRTLRRHYDPVRLIDLLDPAFSLAGKPKVVVTFDDGYANNLHHALPILQEFLIPATVFVATGNVGTDRLFWWDRLCLAQPARQVAPEVLARIKRLPPDDIEQSVERLLAATERVAPDVAPESHRSLRIDEIHALVSSGLIDIGSHTHGHEIIENLPDESVLATLSKSLASLAEWGVPSSLFAAPNGDYLDHQISLMRELGLKLCVSTRPGLWRPSDSTFRIPRFGIGRGCSHAEFSLTVSGALHKLRRAWS